MAHHIMIPEDLWQWGKTRFRANNPGDGFRMILAREQGREQGIEQSKDAEPMLQKPLVLIPKPAANPKRPIDTETYSDPFPAEFCGYCWGSGARIEVGDLICMKQKKPYLFKWVRENML